MMFISVIDCGSAEIVEPENGQVIRSEGTTFNARAIFSCDESFTLVGDAVRICGESGWSRENPTCGKYTTSQARDFAYYSIATCI